MFETSGYETDAFEDFSEASWKKRQDTNSKPSGTPLFMLFHQLDMNYSIFLDISRTFIFSLSGGVAYIQVGIL